MPPVPFSGYKRHRPGAQSEVGIPQCGPLIDVPPTNAGNQLRLSAFDVRVMEVVKQILETVNAKWFDMKHFAVISR
jgi:hypothetical protein